MRQCRGTYLLPRIVNTIHRFTLSLVYLTYVSSEQVSFARVVSEAGRRLTLENPWAARGHKLCVRNITAGGMEQALPLVAVSGGHMRVDTVKGGSYSLEPCPAAAAAAVAAATRVVE